MNLDRALAEISRLRAVIEERDEEIRQLRDASRATFAYPSSLRLTATEARLLTRLLEASPGVLSLDRLRLLCLGREETQDKTIHVHVAHVREKLAPHGVKLRCHYSEGYSIEREDAAALRAIVSPQ